MDKKIRIYEVLPRLIKEQRISVAKLAKMASVPSSTISTWLLPSAKPADPIKVAKVAEVLNVSMHFLLFGEQERETVLHELPTQTLLDGYYRIRLERVIDTPQKNKK